jgi:hypothetical protein
MNRILSITLAALVAPSLFAAGSALAAPDAPPQSCANIAWNPAFLKEYPKAPITCRDVTVKDGVKYAKFMGKVSKVGKELVQVEMSDVGGFAVSTIAFQVGVGGRITLNDTKTEKVSDLRVGDDLTFWVREGEFGVSPTLVDHPVVIIKPETMPAT